MGPTDSPTTPSSGPFYIWEPPEKTISVHLRFDTIERMSPEILRGLGALKRRGAEVGGLLLGTSDTVFPQRITVEDFEPVATEYLTGPSYNLSANDLAGLDALLARRQADPNARLQVVGFYRSHTRDDLYMDDADEALASRYFAGDGHVFLIVKPFATRTGIGGFFFWEDGQISRQSSYLEFPFNRTELGGGPSRTVSPPAARPESERPPQRGGLAPERPAPAAEQDPWPSIRHSSMSILQAPPEPVSRLGGKRWMLAPVFLLLAGAAAFYGYQNLSGPKAFAPTAPAAGTALPLKLSVVEKQDQIDVTWDRNAPAIALARRGVLAISDGANRRDLELTGAQLRNGRVLYSRLSSDVALRLEVFPESGESVSESIRIVSGDPRGLAVAEPAPAPTRQATPAAMEPPTPDRSTAVAPPMETPREIPREVSPRRVAPPSERPAAARVEPAARPAAPMPAAEPDIELERPARRR